MIYLIAGSPRCGKTTLAKRFSKSWISADTIESMVVRSTNKKDLDRLFPKNAVRKVTKQSNDIMYDSYSAKEISHLYIRQSKATWKAIETMVACELKECHDYVIEGHQIHPRLISKIIKKYGKKNIVALVLTRFNKDEIVAGCKKHRAKNDWFIQKTKNEGTFYKIAGMIKVYSEFFKRESDKYGIRVINMDGDFSEKLKEAVDYIKKT